MASIEAQFVHYPSQAEASCHLLDADTLWVGTENGVFKMLRNGDFLDSWPPEPNFQNVAPNAICKDLNGRILLSYNSVGIRRYDGTNWEIIAGALTPLIGNLSFASIEVDDQNRILLSGTRLYRQNGTDWEVISPAGIEFQKMVKAPSGQYFFVGKNQIYAWDGASAWDSTALHLPNMQFLFDICLDSSGDLYGVFYENGSNFPQIWKFMQGDLGNPQFVVSGPYAYNGVNVLYAESICVDASGKIILNLNGPDFHFLRWDGAVWTALGGENAGPFGTNQYEAADLTADPDGSIWMSDANRNQPLFRLSDTGIFHPFGRSLTGQEGVAAPDGKIWFCGARFITSYDPKTKTFQQFFPKAGTIQFWYSIAASPLDGAIYAGDKTQIWKYDGLDWSVFHDFGAGFLTDKIEIGSDNWLWATISASAGNDLLFGKNTATGQVISIPADNSNNYNDLTIAADSSVWVAHKDRLFRYKNGTFSYFDASTVGYPFNVAGITTEKVAFDAAGNLWTFISRVGLVKYDGTNWTVFTTQNSGLLVDDRLYDFGVAADGGIWMAHFGLSDPSSNGIQHFDGFNWETYTTDNSNVAAFPIINIVPASDGTIWFSSNSALFSIRFLSRWLRGNVLRDDNADCLPNPMEVPLNQWVIQAENTTTFEKNYARTFADGRYEMNLDSAVYTVSLIPPAPIWDDCGALATVDLQQKTQDTLDFSGEKVADCPLMNLDVSVPFLRRCFPNTYIFQYCNLGTVAADSVWIDINLPAELNFLGMNVGYEVLSPIQLRVPIGAVAAGDCGSFSLGALVDCATDLGKTLCLEAHILPDSFCLDVPGWSGADLHAEAVCQNDTVFFKIKNQGTGDMSQVIEYIVIEDEVIMRQGPILLPAGDSILVPFVPTSGYQRIQFPQEPGHPFFGLVSAGIEGCGATSNGWFFTGYPFEDPSPFYENECAEVIGSFDPNDKAALPQGVGNQQFILPETKIDYKIRFQNTGTDTAFTVAILDTLSTFLDITSFQAGAASHPYIWNIDGQGILTFTFNNILLPDSTTDETSSHGFVKFSIKPSADTPLGTVVENRAGIYFDFNDVVLTNTVFHTVDTGFLSYNMSIATHGVFEKKGLHIYPNPATDFVSITLKTNHLGMKKAILKNSLGQVVLEKKFNGNRFEMRRGSFLSGLYFLEIWDAGKVVARGKVLWE